MNPEILGISACDLESLEQDQGTQTSSVSIDRIFKPPSRTSRPPLPRDISKSDKGSVTVFEFCQIIQDPETPQDVILIKETVTEETKPHHSSDQDNKSSTSQEEFTANRYKYCREVIKPYLKHSADCSESEEEVLKNALDSVSEDFPDYQPCFEVFDGGEKDISEKSTGQRSRRSSISKVDASTSTSSTNSSRNSTMEENNKRNKCVSKTKSTEGVAPQCPKPVEQCKESESKIKSKKSAECKKKCSPKPSTIVLCDSCEKEPAIGTKCKNPSYYLTERCKDRDSIPNIPPPESEDSIIEKNIKAISTIKVAMEDFVGKVYKSTKDAVTLITTESAKQIDKVKSIKTESSNTDGPRKCSETKGSETLTSFNFFRKVDSTDTHDTGSGKPELPSVAEVIGNIISKVDSTLSTLGDHLSMESVSEALNRSSFNDSSSTYDNPAPPKKVSNILISIPTPLPVPAPVPTSNSVFATIKDKIVSMFREEEPKPTESASQSSIISSSSSLSDTRNNEETDDIINKVIE